MKNLELLDMIGEVDEDYVLAAGENVVKPRFRWQTLAVCAACAAFILAAYPAYRMSRPQGPGSDSISNLEDAPEADQDPGDTLIQRPGLHEYTLVEGGMTVMTTEGNAKAPAGGAEEPAPMPDRGGGPVLPSEAYGGGESADGAGYDSIGHEGVDGIGYNVSGQDAPVQEASAQYERLLQSLGLWGIDGRGLYPEWCGGVWLDGELLSVAIVNQFRSPGLEAQITEWCGGTGEIIFTGVKYSQNYLDDLMGKIDRVFDELDCHIFLSYGVYVTDNRIHLDFFEVPSDEVLAALAELDPDGDAIFIQVFTDRRNILTDGSVKGPVPSSTAEPVFDSARVEPSIEAEPTPTPVEDSEWTMPAEEPG